MTKVTALRGLSDTPMRCTAFARRIQCAAHRPPCWGRFELKMSSASEVSAVFHAKDGQKARKIQFWGRLWGAFGVAREGFGPSGGRFGVLRERPGAPGTVPGASREVRGRPGGAPGTVREGHRTLRSRFFDARSCPGTAFGRVVLLDACYVQKIFVFSPTFDRSGANFVRFFNPKCQTNS